MKKILSALLVLLAVFAVASCVSEPAPAAEGPKPMEAVLTPDILEHKGTALGANVPAWTMSYIEGGSQAVEKPPSTRASSSSSSIPRARTSRAP